MHFRDRCERWVAVEHNENWYKVVKDEGGLVYHKEDFYEYTKYPGGDDDLIIVDGKWRNECLENVRKQASDEAIVLCHDARRTQYLEEVKQFTWCRKIGDDLFIMSNTSPSSSMLQDLSRFEPRPIMDPSYPWDPIHSWGYELDRCGFQM